MARGCSSVSHGAARVPLADARTTGPRPSERKLVVDRPHHGGQRAGEGTNLHTHGLHVSPLSPGDNVLITIPAGEIYVYESTSPTTTRRGRTGTTRTSTGASATSSGSSCTTRHILNHEDNGMMAVVEVAPSG